MPHFGLAAAIKTIHQAQLRLGIGQHGAFGKLRKAALGIAHEPDDPGFGGSPVLRIHGAKAAFRLAQGGTVGLQSRGVLGGLLQHIGLAVRAVDQGELQGLRLALRIQAGTAKACGLQAVDGGGFGLALRGLEAVFDDLGMGLARAGRHRLEDQRGIASGVQQRQLLGAVLQAPAHRCGQRDAQSAMVKIAAAHQALIRALAKSDALYQLEVTLVAVVHVPGALAKLRRPLRDLLQALVVGGVRGQPTACRGGRLALGLGLVCGKALLVLEHGDHLHHVLRVVMVACQVFSAQAIGLQLLVAPVGGDIAGSHSLRHLVGELPGAAQALTFQHCAQHIGGKHTQTGMLLAGSALRAVAGGDVADFVAHDAGQIGLALHIGHDAARHIDVATGQGKGVDLRAVQHGEMPLQIGAV